MEKQEVCIVSFYVLMLNLRMIGRGIYLVHISYCDQTNIIQPSRWQHKKSTCVISQKMETLHNY